MRTIAIFAFGLFVGVGVIVACGDDSPGDADAAVVCDCPAAEPPIEERLVRYTDDQTFAPGERSGLALAQCNDGGVAIHGSCSSGGTMFLMDSGSPDGTYWRCIYRNDDGDAHDATATVLCLLPPPE
jgi:hypothetical protein